jgi:LacI family transcriptional regulator
MAPVSRKPNIADIARLAGVSTATVDRVLNDRGGVKPAREARVVAAARQLKVDRVLVRRYSRVLRIAVLIQSSANPFHEALRDAFVVAARAYADLNLQFLMHHIPPDGEAGIAAAIRSLGARHDGLILTARNGPKIAAATREVAASIPVIALATDLPDTGRWAYVGPDDLRAGRVAGDLMGRFLADGGGEIIMIAGLLSIEGQKQRESGFRQVLREHHPRCRLAAVLESGESAERAGLLVLQALKENPAIRGVYHASAGAQEVVNALRALGRSNDVALITHELTSERRALLRQRAIDAIIDQNPEFETRAATETMARFLGRLEGEASSVITSIQIYTPENA